MSGIYNFLSNALPFIGVLSIVVFIHEYGHFIVGRYCGVTVEAFSIGMGREICGFNDRYGTRWKLSWIPIGGYVRFVDDTNSASVPTPEGSSELTAEERAGALQNQSLPKRTAIIAAGPAFSIGSGLLFYIILFWVFGTYAVEPTVQSLVPGGAAMQAGLKPGDRIVEIDGTAIDQFLDLQRIVTQNPDKQLQFTIKRDGVTQTTMITPTFGERVDLLGNKVKVGLIGVIAGKIHHESHGFFDAVRLGFKQTGDVATQIVTSLPKIPFAIAKVFRFEEQSDLGGAIAIAQMSGEAAKSGAAGLLCWIAAFSVMLGVMNLLPIPILDGGHLMFYALEAVRGKALEPSKQMLGAQIGLAIIATLMVAGLVGDFTRLSKLFFGLG